ncbi:MAG: hypothetical protein AAFZ49_06590 [Cyanobacteria bacterium J06659_2]
MESQSGSTAPGTLQTALAILGLVILGQHPPQVQLPQTADGISVAQAISISDLPEILPDEPGREPQVGQYSNQGNSASGGRDTNQNLETGAKPDPQLSEARSASRSDDDDDDDDD